MKFAIVTVSDSSSCGTRKDESGPTLVALIRKSEVLVDPQVSEPTIIPDEREKIVKTLKTLSDSYDVILTTGGTGWAPRDVTPEATIEVVDRRCGGLEMAIHMRSLQSTPFAALSRLTAGIRHRTLIVNFPGSTKAVKECWEVLEPILNHGVQLLTNTDDGSVHHKLQSGKHV